MFIIGKKSQIISKKWNTVVFQNLRYFSKANDDALEDEIRSSIKSLCNKFPGSYWQELDKKRAYPSEFVKALTSSGYLALLIPEQFGGSGLGIRHASAVLEEIHRSGCNGGAAHAQMYTMATLLKHGSTEQKETFLPKIASGDLRMQAFGVSEPNSGTNTLSLETTAVEVEDGWKINGTKLWTSRAEYSDLMLLLAKTTPKHEEKNVSKSKWLSTFLVDMNKTRDNGLTIKSIDTMINHSTCEVHFDNVVIPKEALIGEVGKGFSYILDSMNAERILIASECIGDGKFFIDRMVKYANEREVFGRPVGQNQGIQFPIAEAYAQLEAADLMVQKACSYFDRISRSSSPSREEKVEMGRLANLSKLLASEASWKAADVCMQTHGGFAFASEFDVERKWREARLYRIAPISTNLIYSYIAEKILGLPRSY